MDGNPQDAQRSRPVSTVSTDSVPPPPPHAQQQPELAAPVVHVDADEFDETRCTVIYDFSGKDVFLKAIRTKYHFDLISSQL